MTIEGQPWFVAKDVCDVLGLPGYASAHTDRLDNDEVRVLRRDSQLFGSRVPSGLFNTRSPSISLVNESGLYALILKSRKPEAQAFRKWVTSVVLPAIRKDGSYVMGEEKAATGEMSEDELIARAMVAMQAPAHYLCLVSHGVYGFSLWDQKSLTYVLIQAHNGDLLLIHLQHAMQRIAYYRVSTSDQTIESQRHAMGGDFAMEFQDEGVSGAIPALERPGFAAMLASIKAMKRKPELCVYAVDRLGRDSIDVQSTVRDLRAMGVRVNIHGLGVVEGEAGELLLTMLAQFAQMERNRIKARAEAGRAVARKSLEATGKTHKGKASLGRPMGRAAGDVRVVPAEVVKWRKTNDASIGATAKHWGLSTATVKRYCAAP